MENSVLNFFNVKDFRSLSVECIFLQIFDEIVKEK